MTEFILKTNEQRVSAIEELANLELAEHNWVVTIEDKKRDRSLEQNKLLWLWNGIVGKEQGVSANYVHGLSKREVLLPYLMTVPRHAEEAIFVKAVIDSLTAESHKIKASYDMVKSSKLNTSEMSDYLNMYRIYWAMNLQIDLPDGDDLIHETGN